MRVIKPRRRSQSMQQSTRMRVAHIREQISDGSYDTSDRLALAIEAFLREEKQERDCLMERRPTHRAVRTPSYLNPGRTKLRLVRA